MMHVKKTVKKIAALAAGATLVGSTLLGASAADLSNFPAPFIQDGVFDAVMVVGKNADVADVIGVTDIAMALQFSSVKKSAVNVGGAAKVMLEGDSVEIGDPSDLLELNETIGDVRETITEFELEALRGGSITTDQGSTEYNQYLRFKDNTLPLQSARVIFGENDEVREQVGDFLFVLESTNLTQAIFEYELEFEEGLESEIKFKQGTTGSRELRDLEDESFNIFGTEYTFVDSDVKCTPASDRDTTVCPAGAGADNENSVELEFIGGDVADTINEGETKTYNIGGKEYEVTLLIVADSQGSSGNIKAKFKVNGEITDEMEEGETDILNDGLQIGVRNILANEYEGGKDTPDLVEFFLGANKITFKDNNYTDSITNAADGNYGFYQGTKVSEEDIEEGWVQIQASVSGKIFKIDSIQYRLLADAITGQSNIYIPPGHGLREFLDEPEGMLNPEWDLRYEGFMETGDSIITIDAQGDDKYYLTFTNRQGNTYRIPLAAVDANGNFKMGDDKDNLVFVEGNVTAGMSSCGTNDANCSFPIQDDDYFVLSNQGTTTWDETAFSHVLTYESIDTANKILTFDDVATGTRQIRYKDSTNSALLGEADLVVGGNVYKVYIQNNATGGYPLAIDQNNDGLVNHGVARITVQGGGIILLNEMWNSAAPLSATFPTTGFNLTLHTESSEFDEQPGDENLNVSILFRQSQKEVGLIVDTVGAGNSKAGLTLNEPDDNDDHKFGASLYGVLLDYYDQSGTDSPEELTIKYPLSQRGVQVFVTAGSTKAAKTGGEGVVETTEVVRIDVGAAVLDSDVLGQEKSENMIVVGGPCANKVAQSLLGVSSSFPECAAGLKPGEARIKLLEHDNGKQALLVYGYDAKDTTAAARVIAEYDKYQDEGLLVGTDLLITDTTSSSPKVEPYVEEASAPSEEASSDAGEGEGEGEEQPSE